MAIVLYDLAGAEDDRRFSPYCWRTKMALQHKGLEFETIPWRFTEKDEIAFTGSTTVPVIVDGERAVYDSWRHRALPRRGVPAAARPVQGTESRALSRVLRHWAFRSLHAAAAASVILPGPLRRIHEKDRPTSASRARSASAPRSKTSPPSQKK